MISYKFIDGYLNRRLDCSEYGAVNSVKLVPPQTLPPCHPRCDTPKLPLAYLLSGHDDGQLQVNKVLTRGIEKLQF